jgi:hypothetical protein
MMHLPDNQFITLVQFRSLSSDYPKTLVGPHVMENIVPLTPTRLSLDIGQ